MAKMHTKWVVLCSAAVAAVYAAGYLSTESQTTIRPTHQDLAQVQINAYSNETPNPGDQINKTNQYKDGTFTGMGSNRRGSIQVAVTLKDDKITDVEISDFAMHYSESDVVGLPAEVMHNQTAQVENVSGATYSTRAFQDAVQDALDQAKNV